MKRHRVCVCALAALSFHHKQKIDNIKCTKGIPIKICRNTNKRARRSAAAAANKFTIHLQFKVVAWLASERERVNEHRFEYRIVDRVNIAPSNLQWQIYLLLYETPKSYIFKLFAECQAFAKSRLNCRDDGVGESIELLSDVMFVNR